MSGTGTEHTAATRAIVCSRVASTVNFRSRRQEMERLQRLPALALPVVVFLALVAVSDLAAVHDKRSVSETSPTGDMSLVKLCHNSTPCGWAVYIPFTRRVDYFMKNTCECPKGKDCVRTEDDLSVSAYVYKCQPSTTARPEAEEGS